MSKEKTTTARAANSGSWKLSFSSSRSTRINDLREFKEDCIATHEAECGAGAGPVLRLGHASYKVQAPAPMVPKVGDFTDKDDPDYIQAVFEHQGLQTMWLQSCKSSQHHKDTCESGVLPKTFVWILSRLDADLRARVEQEAAFSALDVAMPRDPPAVLALIETVMSKGEMDDEGYDDFVVVRDLFGAQATMKDSQSLIDGVRMYKDKMLHVQSKPAYFCKYMDGAGNEQTKQVFTEEFFVNLMLNDLPKKYDEYKVAYANQVSSSAIKRIVTFDALTKYFSSVRNVTTGDVVSASALTTTGTKKSTPAKKKFDKAKPTAAPAEQAKRVFDKSVHRHCRHCNGAHFDNVCPNPKKQVKSSGEPSQDEIAAVLDHLRKKKAAASAKEAKALAAAAVKFTAEDIDYALEEYASARS